MSSLHAVIMAGGSGTRFWPASRQTRPKQMLPLAGGEPMIAAAVARMGGVCPPENVWIVTNETQRPGIEALLPEFSRDNILIEPEPRDTAPCLAFAAAAILARESDATMVVLPADQVIEPVNTFQQMLRRGLVVAKDRRTLVTFGVKPTHAATGFGYIEVGDALDEQIGGGHAHEVRSFREKPDAKTAQRFVDDGGFWWNSGIVAFHVEAMLHAMQTCEPKMAAATDKMLRAIRAGDDAARDQAFCEAPKTSIDYAVMEKAEQIAVVQCTANWDDVGSFPALTKVTEGDRAGNHVSAHDGGSAAALDSRDNVVYVEGKRTVAMFGVEGMVVCAVGDAVLVCPKDKAGDLKQMVEHLRSIDREDLL